MEPATWHPAMGGSPKGTKASPNDKIYSWKSRMSALNMVFTQGAITEEEYNTNKQVLLQELHQPALSSTPGSSSGSDAMSELPHPKACPPEGVMATSMLQIQPTLWIFIGNHISNLEQCAADNIKNAIDKGLLSTITYPVRMRKSAGFVRRWGVNGFRRVGEQTITGVLQTESSKYVPAGTKSESLVEAGQEHAMVGVLVPLKPEAEAPPHAHPA